MTSTATAKAPRAREPKTPEEKFAGVHRQIRALEEVAAGEDPWAVAELLEIAAEAEAAAVRVVARLRETDPATGKPKYTWDAIAASLPNGKGGHITALTALKRYGGKK